MRKSVGVPLLPDPASCFGRCSSCSGSRSSIFVIARVMPGDPARMALGPRASQEQVDDLKAKMGLDKPLVEQYQHFIVGLVPRRSRALLSDQAPGQRRYRRDLRGDLRTRAGDDRHRLRDRRSARRRRRGEQGRLGRQSRCGSGAILGAVTPSFLLALLLQVLAGYVLHVAADDGAAYAGFAVPSPTSPDSSRSTRCSKGNLAGFVDALKHLLLPALALSAATIGQIARITRSSMIDVAKQDYIEAARAFGVPDRVRIFKYMLRPAFVPPMTILGLEFASLIGNAFVVELVFAWPGMASYGVRSILQKDLNAVMGVVMISGPVLRRRQSRHRRACRLRRSARPDPGRRGRERAAAAAARPRSRSPTRTGIASAAIRRR